MTSSAPATAYTETLKNLQAAYEGESNAREKYLAFAAKADDEGYADVASLFRAAARAEYFHAQNHAKVIRTLGAEPTCEIHEVKVGSTAENLKAGIEGEEYERDVMYPSFIAEAQASGHKAAVRTFQWALDAEAEHATLYRTALENLEAGRAKVTYYVCVICGFTTADAELARCLICATPREKFETVS